MIAAASTVCPVVHTTLNWIVIVLLLAVFVAIVGGVFWGAYERHLERRRAAAPPLLGELPPPAPQARKRW